MIRDYDQIMTEWQIRQGLCGCGCVCVCVWQQHTQSNMKTSVSVQGSALIWRLYYLVKSETYSRK